MKKSCTFNCKLSINTTQQGMSKQRKKQWCHIETLQHTALLMKYRGAVVLPRSYSLLGQIHIKLTDGAAFLWCGTHTHTHTHRNRLPFGIHLWKASHAFPAYIPNAAWHLLYGWAGETGIDSAISCKDKDKIPGLNTLYWYIHNNVSVCYMNVYTLGHFSVLWTMWSNESRLTLIFSSCQSRINMAQTSESSAPQGALI